MSTCALGAYTVAASSLLPLSLRVPVPSYRICSFHGSNELVEKLPCMSMTGSTPWPFSFNVVVLFVMERLDVPAVVNELALIVRSPVPAITSFLLDPMGGLWTDT